MDRAHCSPPADPARRRWLGGALGTVAACAAPLSACSLPGRHGGVGAEALRPAAPGGESLQLLQDWVAAPLTSDAGANAAAAAPGPGQRAAGVQYLPLDGSRRGLLLLTHAAGKDGPAGSAAQVLQAQAAQGLSVLEIAHRAEGWEMQPDSPWARRIDALTAIDVAGPAAGHALLKTATDPDGRRILGLLAPGPMVLTPWGSCLAGEADFAPCFATADQPTRDERRWGLGARAPAGWPAFDPRFDTVRHANEPHRHGWIVEFDPRDAAAVPVQRTALGRAAHAGLALALTREGRIVVLRSDGGRGGSFYKFISRDALAPRRRGAAPSVGSGRLLDDGELFVARFDADGSGHWLPLTATGADAAAACIRTRQAGDAAGGTRWARPGGLAIAPGGRWVQASVGPTDPADGPERLLRWRDEGDHDGLRFEWQAVGEATPLPPAPQGPDDTAAAATTFAFDARGGLWRSRGAELLFTPATGGAAHTVLAAPHGSRVGGTVWTPDGRTLFVNVGVDVRLEGPSPGLAAAGGPASATLSIHRGNGGSIAG
jgi:secreted PhoX family phosphatase